MSVVGIFHLQRAGVTTRLIGCKTGHQQAGGMAAKEFTLVFHATGFESHPRKRLGYVKLTAVVSGIGQSRKLNEKIAEHLISAHPVVVAGGILIASPKAVLVDNETLLLRSAENQRA